VIVGIDADEQTPPSPWLGGFFRVSIAVDNELCKT
jgi:hypothetical protein